MFVFKRYPVVVLERIAMKDCPEADRKIPNETKKEVGFTLSEVLKNKFVSKASPKRNAKKQEINGPHNVKYNLETSTLSGDDASCSKETRADIVVDVKKEKGESGKITHELVGYFSDCSGKNQNPSLMMKCEDIKTENCHYGELNIRFNQLGDKLTIHNEHEKSYESQIQSKVYSDLRSVGLAYASVRLEGLSSRTLRKVHYNQNLSVNCLGSYKNHLSAENSSENHKTSSLKAESNLQFHKKRFECTMSNGNGKNFSYPEKLAKEDNNEKLFQCELCLRKLKYSHHLRRHMLSHSDEAPYQCNQCPKRFKRSDHLKIHLSVHSTEKALKCSHCPKQFTRTDRFNNHLRQHGERPFKCNRCSETFFQWFDRSNHLRVHSGERSFNCNQCPEKFIRKGALTFHLRVHSGERLFDCNQCSAKFARKSNLNAHLRVHSGERPFHCNQCSAKFTKKGALNTHLQVHSGERPYECSQCSQSFRYRAGLNFHLKKHHSK